MAETIVIKENEGGSPMIESAPNNSQNNNRRGDDRRNNNPSGNERGLDWTRIGVRPVGHIYDVTSRMISQYFTQYFEKHGYTGICFANRKTTGSGMPRMYFVFGRNNLQMKKKNTDERVAELLGGNNHGTRIKLDEKLRELVKPFVPYDEKGRGPFVQAVKEDKKYVFIELDPARVMSHLFGSSNEYEVGVLDCEGKSGHLSYRVSRMRRPLNDEPGIIEISNRADLG